MSATQEVLLKVMFYLAPIGAIYLLGALGRAILAAGQRAEDEQLDQDVRDSAGRRG